MRLFAVLGAVVCALAVPTLAAAGGWASVGFDPLPDGTSAGGTWKPTIFVKQHGITPLAGLQPVVLLEEASGAGGSAQFFGVPGSEPGVYHADVVFPSAGDWKVTIESGFGDSHVTYGPVSIPDGSPGGVSEPLPVLGFGALAVAIVGALALLALRRSRRLSPASG
jgi:hypothetical protein